MTADGHVDATSGADLADLAVDQVVVVEGVVPAGRGGCEALDAQSGRCCVAHVLGIACSCLSAIPLGNFPDLGLRGSLYCLSPTLGDVDGGVAAPGECNQALLVQHVGVPVCAEEVLE